MRANAPAGFAVLLDKLERLGASPEQILIGLEATSRYGENLYRLLDSRGYQLCLLHTAQQLLNLAQHTISSGVALPARSTSLKILCDQLEHTQANLLQLEHELENLMKTDTGAKGEASCS